MPVIPIGGNLIPACQLRRSHLRPCVIARKVSGGTRSAKGSVTKAVLMSLFGTWLLRGQDTMQMCRQMLISDNRRAYQATHKTILSHAA